MPVPQIVLTRTRNVATILNHRRLRRNLSFVSLIDAVTDCTDHCRARAALERERAHERAQPEGTSQALACVPRG